MNRQEKRRYARKLSLSAKEVDNMAEHFRRENELLNRDVVQQFLALVVEALRLEFGFGEKRIARFGARVNDLLDSVNLDYLTFDDLMDQMSLKPMHVATMSDEMRAKKLKELDEYRRRRKAG